MKILKLLKLPKIVIRLFIAFVVISLIVGLGSAFNGDSVQEQKVSKTKLSVNKANAEEENKATKTHREIVEDTTKETMKSDKLSTESVDTGKMQKEEIKIEKETSKQNTEVPKNTTETQKQTTSTSTNEIKQKNEAKENKQEEIKQEEQKEETIKETPKKIEIWDELGITEYEYYNTPMWKWATVDFSIEKYGSQEACFNACTEYGESTGMGYSCSIINSYSGRYLGEMIELF